MADPGGPPPEAPPSVEDLPSERAWFVWKGRVSEPSASDGAWRSLPHLQNLESWQHHMGPRIEEFAKLLDWHGLRPETVECCVCRQPGRSFLECLTEDAVAGGGRNHLKKLWSLALSTGPAVWAEVELPGGGARYNHVDGMVQLCRGEFPRAPSPQPSRRGKGRRGTTSADKANRSGEASPGASRSGRGGRSKGRRQTSTRKATASSPPAPMRRGTSTRRSRSSATLPSLHRDSEAASSSMGHASSMWRSASSSGPVSLRSRDSPRRRAQTQELSGFKPVSSDQPALQSQTVAQDAANAGVDADSEHEDRFVFETRPLGLEISSASHDGRGAVITQAEGQAAAAGMEAGSTILCINEQSVEDMPTKDIQGILDTEKLPLTLDVRPPLNLPTVQRRKRRKRDPVTLCTYHCRQSYRVVTESLERLGWQDIPAETRSASVIWLEHQDATTGLAPQQTITRIEAFYFMCRKSRLAQSLNAWVDELPDEFGFSPKTFILPYDAAELKSAMIGSGETFIAKPTAGCQGKGIVLARKWKDLETVVQKTKAAQGTRQLNSVEYVVQPYFTRPLLIDTLKFDMRLYVVVTSVVPLRAYLFKEGLARFCTVPYEVPKEDNLRDTRMHLTNYAVNKNSKDFKSVESLDRHDEGSKRSVSSVLYQIEKINGTTPDEVWEKVAKLAANTLMALRPGLLEFHVHEQPRPLHPLGPKSVQIVGLDVLIDSSLEPRLLEINANPALSVTQPGAPAEPDSIDESPDDGGDALAEPAEASTVDGSQPPAAEASASSVGRLRRPGITIERVTSDRPVSAGVAQSSQGRRGRRHLSRSKTLEPKKGVGGHKVETVTSELDLEVKRELVTQALLLARPAPQNKTSRMRRMWQGQHARDSKDLVPLDDEGVWSLSTKQTRAEATRPDAPEKCPAMVALDFEELAAPEVIEYARAHLSLYRFWTRSCGPGKETLGQAQMVRLVERGGLVGSGGIFADKVTAQLWFARNWRDAAGGAFGLNLPQFVTLVGRLGAMMASGGAGEEDPNRQKVIAGVMEFMSRNVLAKVN